MAAIVGRLHESTEPTETPVLTKEASLYYCKKGPELDQCIHQQFCVYVKKGAVAFYVAYSNLKFTFCVIFLIWYIRAVAKWLSVRFPTRLKGLEFKSFSLLNAKLPQVALKVTLLPRV